MGISVNVSLKFNREENGFEIHEPVSSMSKSPRCILGACKMITGKYLYDIESQEEQKEALARMIQEIDRGDDGIFNNEWGVENCLQDNSTKDYASLWKSLPDHTGMPEMMNSEKKWVGHWMRADLREQAQRFYLYFRSGCDVEFN